MRWLSKPRLSNTKIRCWALLSNHHRPSPGAVHRYQVVAATGPNHSPGSRVAPPAVALNDTLRTLNHGGLLQVIVDGAGSLGPAEF